MTSLTRRTFSIGLAATLAGAAPGLLAQQPGARKPQFVYVMRVAPAFHDRAAWTDKENATVGRHFVRLQKATESGQVILAGRTNEALDKTFGLVVFEADNEEAARQFMNTDPAVEAGLMTATLHSYGVALLRKP